MNAPAAIAYLLCGPSLAGKSRVAAELVTRLAVTVISADDINARRGLPFGGEGLPESVWAETLRIQLEQLRSCAAEARSVVVDDTLCYRWLRNRFRQEATLCGMQHRLLLLQPPPEELIVRYQQLLRSRERPVLSVDRLHDHLARFEWPSPDEGAVDVTEPAALEAFLVAEQSLRENVA